MSKYVNIAFMGVFMITSVLGISNIPLKRPSSNETEYLQLGKPYA